MQTTLVKPESMPAPAWLPPDFDANNFRHSFHFCKGERRVFRHREYMAPSEWAPKHRMITTGPMEGAMWRNDITPYLVGIMDASFYRSVQVVSICAAPQIGKSALVDTCLGYCMDRQPGTALVVYPDKITAVGNNVDRIQKMINGSACLRSLLTGVDDDMSGMRVKLKTMLLYMGWAGSATSLGNRSIRYLILDEVDKYNETPSKVEAGTIALAEKRTRSYRYGKKIWKISTPTVESGNIWQALTTSQVIFEYSVVCPLCAAPQVMRLGDKETAGGLKWPRNEDGSHPDPEKLQAAETAWYECEHCRRPWSDTQRDQAVRHGRWLAKNDGRELFTYLKTYNPRSIGFHIPAWLSFFVSLSEIAAAYIKTIGDKTALKDFLNSYAAEPWLEYEKPREEDAILKLKDERPAGLIPGKQEIAALVAGVDTQDNGFWYMIMAVGYGLTEDMWLIEYGFLDSTAALDEVLFRHEYLDESKTVYHPRLTVQDAMGHRTTEVYDYCRTRPGMVIPYKGYIRKSIPLTWAKVDTYPGTNRPMPGDLRRIDCDTTLFKDKLNAKLTIKPGDPGSISLHGDTDMDFARQLTAEYRDDDGIWQCPSGRANHLWDCAMMCLVAAEVLKIRNWPRPGAKKAATKPRQPGVNPITQGHSLLGGGR